VDLIYRYDPTIPLTLTPIPDADAAIQTLTDGNNTFVEYVSKLQQRTLGESPESMVMPIHPVSLGLPIAAGVKLSQAPFAIVVGCSDARVNIETIFSQWMNGMFVVRMAGNVLGTEAIGSIDYAVAQLGKSLRLVLVLGHSDCGAVSAAVDSYLNPQIFGEIAFSHSLRSLLDRIHIAVRIGCRTLATKFGESIAQHPNYREALIDASVYINAAVTAFDLAREIEEIKAEGLRTVFSVYDFETLRVSSLPDVDRRGPLVQAPFRAAPKGPEDLRVLSDEIADAVYQRHFVG
jgi:carbonic anhydrase